jgi:hypothetical protein
LQRKMTSWIVIMAARVGNECGKWLAVSFIFHCFIG